MRARHVLVAVGAVVALAGCSAPSVEVELPQVEVPQVEIPSGAEAAYVAALKQIDGQIAENSQKAVDAGKSICQAAERNESATVLEGIAAQQFSVDTTTAKAIVVLTRSTLCPKS